MNSKYKSETRSYKFNTDFSKDGKVILYQAGTELDIRDFNGLEYVYDRELRLFPVESMMAKLHGKVVTSLN